MVAGPQVALALTTGRVGAAAATMNEGVGWMTDSWRSLCDDPLWHARWTMDVQQKWLHAISVMSKGVRDPRVDGVSAGARASA
jgi:hypothetical protein